MPQPERKVEFDPRGDHEELALEKLQRSIARVAIFDEMIDYYHDGKCTFDQAVTQFLHDAEVAGVGYET